MGWYTEPDTLSIARGGGVKNYNKEKECINRLSKKIKSSEKTKITIISCGLCNYNCKNCGTNNFQ